MTEDEWAQCDDPDRMLGSPPWLGNARRRRLFAVACCRRIWDILRDERSRGAVEMAEQYADGLVPEHVFLAAHRGALQAELDAQAAVKAARVNHRKLPYRVWQGAQAATRIVLAHAHGIAKLTELASHLDLRECTKERIAQCDLLRCIFGNPFRPVKIQEDCLTWRDGLIPKMATTIYRERSFADLRILGDALEEAGCANVDILAHCRSGGEHVRGCWVVDLILGKG